MYTYTACISILNIILYSLTTFFCILMARILKRGARSAPAMACVPGVRWWLAVMCVIHYTADRLRLFRRGNWYCCTAAMEIIDFGKNHTRTYVLRKYNNMYNATEFDTATLSFAYYIKPFRTGVIIRTRNNCARTISENYTRNNCM